MTSASEIGRVSEIDKGRKMGSDPMCHSGWVRDVLANALPRIKLPRGPMRFDAYRQAIIPIYITRTERKGGRIVNVVIDKIPDVSQEATWAWWNKS
jgi:hypothetical protein